MAERELEALYLQAQSALKVRDYDRAAELLKQILREDHEYRDVSRLLAETIKLRRRRWYNHPFMWSAIGLAVVITLGLIVAPRMQGLFSADEITPTIRPTEMVLPTITETPTELPAPSPTPIPLTWKRVWLGQELPRDTVTALTIDPNDPDVLYAGMENAGIYKSIDGGLSWYPILNGLADITVVTLLVDSRDSRTVYAGTPSGIFKSENGGENWSRIGEGTHVLIDPMNNSHLYTRDSDTIYESTDWGKTWQVVYSSQAGCPGMIFTWAIHPTDGNSLFISAGKEECEPGIYQSNDGGRTWTLIEKLEIPPGFEKGWASFLVEEMGWLLVQIEDGNIVIDYGPIWEIPPVAAFVYYRCWEPFLPFLCRSRPNGEQEERLGKPDIWTDDSWDSYVTNIPVITISPHDSNTIYVGGEGVSVTKDGGLTWTKLNNGMGNTILDMAAGLGDERTLFLLPGNCEGELGGGVDQKKDITQSLYFSENGGRIWEFVTESGCYLIRDTNGITIYRLSTNYWWAGDEQKGWLLRGWLWRSQDGGRSWRRILLPPAIETIVAHADQTGHLYGFGKDPFYKTSVNPDFQDQYYFESIDYGDTWTKQEPPAGAKPCYGSTLQFIDKYRPMSIDPSDGNHVFVIDNGILLESHDSCDTTEAFATAPNTSMNSIAFDPNSASTIYAGTDTGAFISFDGGKTWNQINDGLLGATVVYSIVVDKDSNVYAATPYGIFKLEGK